MNLIPVVVVSRRGVCCRYLVWCVEKLRAELWRQTRRNPAILSFGQLFSQVVPAVLPSFWYLCLNCRLCIKTLTQEYKKKTAWTHFRMQKITQMSDFCTVREFRPRRRATCNVRLILLRSQVVSWRHTSGASISQLRFTSPVLSLPIKSQFAAPSPPCGPMGMASVVMWAGPEGERPI